MDAQEITLDSICKGAIREIFAHELLKVAANIGDVNTSAKKAREIVLTFSFAPHPDRSGATVAVTCKTKLGDLDASSVTGSVYLAKREGRFSMFSRDLRQELLFSDERVIPQEPPPPQQDGKSAAGGEG